MILLIIGYRLFRHLHYLDFRTKVMETDFLNRFNDTVIDVPSEDMYYLLQTFASMAMARDIVDIEFIECVTTDLFRVGFTNVITRDSCYKIVRDLLVNITSKNTELISCLLYLMKKSLKLVRGNKTTLVAATEIIMLPSSG